MARCLTIAEHLYRKNPMYDGAVARESKDEDRAFKALGHRDRRAILRVIGDDERRVSEVVEQTGLEQPVVSQHLRTLRDAGLVAVRTDQNRRLYSVDFARFAELRRFLDLFWNEKLAALKRVAESPPRPPDRSPPSPSNDSHTEEAG